MFVHFPIPHPPGFYRADRHRFDCSGDYVDNISLVDRTVGDLRALSEEADSLRAAVDASQSYVRLDRSQFKFGLVDYLVVVDAERTLLANQLQLAQTTNLQMGASVHLIKALGGGWEGLARSGQVVAEGSRPLQGSGPAHE